MNDDFARSLETLHDKQDQQTEKLTELQVCVAKQEASIESFSSQSDRMWRELNSMNKNLANYNAELKVHIAGVMELKEQNRLMREEIKQRDTLISNRLEVAEKPIKWAATTFFYLKWAATIITSSTVVGALVWKLIQWIS